MVTAAIKHFFLEDQVWALPGFIVDIILEAAFDVTGNLESAFDIAQQIDAAYDTTIQLDIDTTS